MKILYVILGLVGYYFAIVIIMDLLRGVIKERRKVEWPRKRSH
mgnify:CR=1 FL=1